ncbi:MAG: FkbM family methyltransferase [Planctomycetia bacterium]|nr:FkbM family methyltransferase [Planctomycetia bacterium]
MVALLERHVDRNRDVVDVGANAGLYSVLFSRLISESNTVLAVEPTPVALKHLRENLGRNNCCSKVVIFEGVVMDRVGTATLSVIPGQEEYSSLGNIVEPSADRASAKSIQVCGTTLDRLIDERKLNPGFIKIDTEGAEYLVLSGAIKTLRKIRPVILSELDDSYLATTGHTAAQVIGLLRDEGYRVVDARTGACDFVFPFHGNVLAVPLVQA